MKIVTFNLRCVWEGDGVNSFVNRAAQVYMKIKAEQPDVIGFQEGVPRIIDLLREMLTGYTVIFNQRSADFGGEGLAIAVRNETVSLIGMDFFWLSDTPSVPGSRFAEQSLCPRITQCALCRRVSDGKLFRFYNVHLDHESDSARILGIKCIMQKIKEDIARYDFPFFLVGDFNAIPGSETVAFCDSYAEVPMVELSKEVGGTYHGFGRREPVKIDYIYADSATAASLDYTAERWEDSCQGVYLSDHYPVCVNIAAK